MQENYLNFLEKRELLEKYRSDLRKIDFERDYLTSIIERIEKELQLPVGTTSVVTEVEQVKVVTPAPAPVVVTTPVEKVAKPVAVKAATPQVRTTPSKPESVQLKKGERFYGFKLSAWDTLMLEILENTAEPLNSSALLDIFENKNNSLAKPLDDKQLRNALSRTVHKLANKKDVVLKQEFEGKGFLYTLNPNYTA